MRISQEAVAAAAFGNPTRKGYISSLENGRLTGIRPETVRRISAAVDLPMEDVPPELRWPDHGLETLPDASAEMRQLEPVLAIIETLNQGMQDRVAQSQTEIYVNLLQHRLARLTAFCGPAFSLRSLLLSISVAYCYIVLAGVVAYAAGGGDIGTLAIFDRPDSLANLPTALLAFLCLVVMSIAAVLSYLWARPGSRDRKFAAQRVLQSPWRIFGIRVMAAGLLLGSAAVISTQLGMHPVAASMIATVAGLCALSSLGARKAAIAGGLGGALAGTLESLYVHQNIAGSIEGGLFGLLVGASASYLAGYVAQRGPSRLISGIAGAGCGAVFGALITLSVFWSLEVLSGGRLNSPVSLLSSQDTTFMVLAVTWAILPVINAVQDFLSYGISQKLARFALAKPLGAWRLISLGILDLMAALGLSASTFFSITLGLWAYGTVSGFDFAPQIFLDTYLQDPFGAAVWMTVMILSTLSWTLMHYVFVLLPAISSYAASGPVHSYVRARVTSDVGARRLRPNTFLVSFAPGVLSGAIYCSLVILSAVAVLGLAL